MKNLTPIRRSLLAAAAAAAASAALAPPATAADWRDGGLITDPERQAQPVRAAVGASGAAFAWPGYVDEGSRPPSLAQRPFGGALGPTRELASDSELVGSITASGDDLLVVSRAPFFGGPARRVLARSGSVTGEIGAPETIVEVPEDETLCEATGSVGPGGRALVLYATAPAAAGGAPEFGRCTLSARVRPAAGAAFGPAIQLGEPAGLSRVDVGFDGQGRALVAWLEDTGAASRVRAARYDGATGIAPAQDVAPPAAGSAFSTLADLRVAANGRAVIAFAARRAEREYDIAAATGDTAAGFGPARALADAAVLAPSGLSIDTAIGDDGTAAVVWRAGRGRAARVRAALAGPGEELVPGRVRTLAGHTANPPRVAVAEGRATIAWSRIGRSRSIARAVEATTGRPGRAFASPRRISTNAAISPFGLQVDVSARGAAWITWGAAPREGASTTFSALKSRKLTVRTGRFSRELTVLRARTGFRDERLTSNFQVLAGRGGSMLAVVERARTRASGEQPDPAGPPVGPATGVNFFQLRTYGE